MKNTRLFWQILYPALFIILLSVSATTWSGVHIIRSFYYEQMREDIKDRALLIRPNILQLLDGNSQKLQEFCRVNGRLANTRITVIRGDGKVLADSNENPEKMDNHGTRPEILLALDGAVGSSFRLSKTLNRIMLYVAIPLRAEKPKDGVLRLSVPAAVIDEVLSTIYHKIILGVCLIGLLAAVFSYRLARRISRPLEEMRKGAEHLAQGGTGLPVAIKSAHISKETSELARALNTMADQITARIKTITRQHNELEAVFASMTDSVLAIGADHRIIRVNRAAGKLFGIQQNAVKGKPVEGLLRNMLLQDFITRALASSTPLEEDLILNIDSRKTILKTRSVPLLNEEGGKPGVLLVMNNLTRVNRLESIRQNFVANVSHELKTPITALHGYVETLLDGAWKNPEELKEFLQIINRQSLRLEAIVDDLLSLARIEDKSSRNKMLLKEEKIHSILESSIQAGSHKAAEKRILVKLNCEKELTIHANRSMLEQAVVNLLTNAIRYS
ncbi:MAG TPA: HAMP domain-containing histidine kinase, partial [Desulfobulbus sp.]|nr:HAMP domain-containing histidine kinase [Desulfobulbus sp.]